MSAIEALRLARENGVHLGVEGGDLLLDADREPQPQLLAAIRNHKAGIVALLTKVDGGRTFDDWHAFFDKHAKNAEANVGLQRSEAEDRAFECCTTEWLNRHPTASDPGRCAWCGNEDVRGHCVVPFGVDGYGHTWLHPDCWSHWHQRRHAEAESALSAIGITKTPHRNCRRPHHGATAEVIETTVNVAGDGSG